MEKICCGCDLNTKRIIRLKKTILEKNIDLDDEIKSKELQKKNIC